MFIIHEEYTQASRSTVTSQCTIVIDPNSLPTFGDGDAFAALDFLRMFKQWMIPMTYMTLEMKAEYFGSCFLPLSPAENWYKSLASLQRTNIQLVILSFENRFGISESAQAASMADLTKSCRSGRLHDHDVGKMTYKGTLDEITWARDFSAALRSVRLPFVSGGTKLPVVQCDCGPEMRKRISHASGCKENDCGTVLAGIGNLSVTELVDSSTENSPIPETATVNLDKPLHVGTTLDTEDLSRAVLVLVNGLLPAYDEITRSFAYDEITRSFDVLMKKILEGSFAKPALTDPETLLAPTKDISLVPANHGEHVLERDGMKEYREQFQQWKEQHAQKTITAFSNVPLTPGTEPAGTGECWWCGIHTGHSSGSYGSRCPKKWLPREERIYREAVYNYRHSPCIRRPTVRGPPQRPRLPIIN